MAPIQKIGNAVRKVLTRRAGGNATIAGLLFGLGFFVTIVAVIALRSILPCALVKKQTLDARWEARMAQRNRGRDGSNNEEVEDNDGSGDGSGSTKKEDTKPIPVVMVANTATSTTSSGS